MRVDHRIKALILERHAQDQPSAGAYDGWCDEIAERFGVSARAVHSVVVKAADDAIFMMEREQATVAQDVAHRLGADRSMLVDKILECLNATMEQVVQFEELQAVQEVMPVWNGSKIVQRKAKRFMKVRNAKTDADGNFVVHRQPNFQVRVMALRYLSEIWGAKVPDQAIVQLTQKQEVTFNLPLDAIVEKQQFLARQLAELGALPPAPAPVQRAIRGASGEADRRRSTVVVDVRNENEGRAGSDGKSLQAIPESPVYSAPAECVREREGNPTPQE